MQRESAERDFQELVDLYNVTLRLADNPATAVSLAIPIPRSVLNTPELHARLRRFRGNAFTRIGENDAADREYELGFYETPVDERGEYVLDWAMATFARLYDPAESATPSVIGDRCMEILGLSDRLSEESSNFDYTAACTHYVRAFLHVYLGDNSFASAELAVPSLPPLPPQYLTDERLRSYFTHLPKGLLAAVELRDEVLLRQVTLGGFRDSEQRQLESRSASVGSQFMNLILNRTDVPKFHSSWALTLETIQLLAPGYPNARRLRSMVTRRAGAQQIVALVNSLVGG
jgi:hypothetical protein